MLSSVDIADFTLLLGLEENDYFEMHELPKAWLPNARTNSTDATEMSREELGKSEKVTCGGGLSEIHETLHFRRMIGHGKADDDEMLETTKSASDVDTPQKPDMA